MRALLLFGASLVGLLAFWIVFWLTFPSATVGQRIAHEVRTLSEGRYEIELDAVAPWWTGLSADRVIVSRADADPTAPRVPVFFVERAAASLSLPALARRVVALQGFLRLGEADVEYDVRAQLREGRMEPARLRVVGAGVPVSEVLALVGGGGAVGLTGAVDVDVDLNLAQGFDKADGKASVRGKGLTLDTISVETLGWSDKEVGADVDEIDLAFVVEDGKAEITSGVVASSLADVEVEGVIDLATELGRSRVKLGLAFELEDWASSPLADLRSVVEGFMASAKQADGSYRYGVDATLSRLGASDLRPERERTRAVPTTPTRRPTPAGDAAAEPPTTASTPVTPPPAAPVAVPAAEEEPPVQEEEEGEEVPAEDEVEPNVQEDEPGGY